MKKWKCPACGWTLHHLELDGYQIGDTLMEGLMFKCERDDKGKWIISVKKSDMNYFKQFNMEMWLGHAQAYCEDIDLLSCPKCGDDIAPDEDEI